MFQLLIIFQKLKELYFFTPQYAIIHLKNMFNFNGFIFKSISLRRNKSIRDQPTHAPPIKWLKYLQTPPGKI